MALLALDPMTGLPKKKNATNPYAGIVPDPAGLSKPGDYPGASYAPTAPAIPTTLTTSGYIPDYTSLISNDPVLVQLKKDLAAQGVSDLGSRNAALNRLLVGFGQIPDVGAAAKSLGINDLGTAIDPTTAALAGENQFSTEARLSKAHTDAIRQIRQGLAARGALQSGELGYQLGNENHAYGQAQSDANQALLDAIASIQSGYTEASRNAAGQLNQGLGAATDREIGLHPATGSQTATYDAATGKYKGADGTWWNADGSPFVGTPPPLNAVPAASPSLAAHSGVLPGGGNDLASQIQAALAASRVALQSQNDNNAGPSNVRYGGAQL